MKTLKLTCLASVAAIALSAGAAQAAGPVSGTVEVQGYVTATCSVNGVEGYSGTWGTPILLGELADGTSGLLKSSLTTAATHGTTVTVSVICNSANPTVQLSATHLSNPATAQAGYTNVVDYTAQVDIAKSPSGTFTETYPTNSALPFVSAQVGSPLATTANNVTVSVNTLSASGVLLAGNYTGLISITITPS